MIALEYISIPVINITSATNDCKLVNPIKDFISGESRFGCILRRVNVLPDVTTIQISVLKTKIYVTMDRFITPSELL